MASISLDVSHDTMGEIETMCAEHALTFEVVEEHGPAGGNPLVKFIGDEKNLREFALYEYGIDEDMFEQLIER